MAVMTKHEFVCKHKLNMCIIGHVHTHTPHTHTVYCANPYKCS